MQSPPSRYLADAQIPFAVVSGLRRLGIDVTTVQDLGMARASDEDILAFAAQDQRVVITIDVDFIRLHQRGLLHFGILRVAPSRNIGQIVSRVAELHARFTGEDLRGRVEYL